MALRAGNEKDTDEAADTVGCCSLRVEHISECGGTDTHTHTHTLECTVYLTTPPCPSPSALHDTLGDEECVVEFDFLGKDSIRYQNKVPVERQVFKNLKLFVKGKQPEDDLFDRLNVRWGVCGVQGVRVGSGTAMCDGVSVVCRGEGGEWHCYVRWGVCGVQG